MPCPQTSPQMLRLKKRIKTVIQNLRPQKVSFFQILNLQAILVKRSKQKQIQELSATNLNAVASSSILPPIPTNKNVKLCGTKRLNATWPSNEESVPNGN